MRHVVGFVLSIVALVSGIGCARTDWIDRTLVTENVTGTWSGSFGEAASYRYVQLDLQHQGPNVTGFIGLLPSGSSTGYQDRRAPIEGSVAGDVFTFKDARGSYSGELTIGGDEMTGRIFGPQGTRQVSLRRANLPAPPNPPPR
jgi:hypothetical protein